MKNILFLLLLLLFFNSCYTENVIETLDVVKPEYYTQINIWYENPDRIFSTNYHKGHMIPAGTNVIIVDYLNNKNTCIVFQEVKSKDKKYTLYYVPNHSSITPHHVFARYIGKENYLVENNFSSIELENIKKGTLVEGMSKKAVITAYGYPPSHFTRNLDYTKWKYWESKFDNTILYFENDKLIKINK